MRNTVLSPMPTDCATCVASSAVTSTGTDCRRFRTSVAFAHATENQPDEQANQQPGDQHREDRHHHAIRLLRTRAALCSSSKNRRTAHRSAHISDVPSTADRRGSGTTRTRCRRQQRRSRGRRRRSGCRRQRPASRRLRAWRYVIRNSTCSRNAQPLTAFRASHSLAANVTLRCAAQRALTSAARHESQQRQFREWQIPGIHRSSPATSRILRPSSASLRSCSLPSKATPWNSAASR